MNTINETLSNIIGIIGTDINTSGIRLIEGKHTNKRINLKYKIKVGNSQLVYISEIREKSELYHTIPSLLLSGKLERDRSGFELLRLVFICRETEDSNELAASILRSLSNSDDNVKISIVQPDDIMPVNHFLQTCH